MPLNRREAKRVAGMQSHEELFVLARTLKDVAQEAQSATFAEPLDAIEKAVETAGKAFSESWMGYHSRVYYANLRTPPSGACFSQEWGLMDTYGTGHGSRGDWKEFDPKTIEKHIAKFAGNPDLTAARMISQRGVATFSSAKASALSILESELAERPDRFLEKLKGEIEGMKPLSPPEVMAGFMMRQQGTVIIRDVRAANQGTQNSTPYRAPRGSSLIERYAARLHGGRRCDHSGRLAFGTAKPPENGSRASGDKRIYRPRSVPSLA